MKMLAENWRASVLGVVILISVTVSDARAQFGSISGKITDGRGAPIRRANIWVSDTYCGGLTDEVGDYVLSDVPAGPRTVNIQKFGYAPIVKQKVVVKSGEDTRIEFSLKVEPKTTDDKVPWWKPPGKAEAKLDTLARAQQDSILEAIALRAGVVSDEVAYEGHIDPVQWQGIEFNVRYFVELDNDSTIVQVVANGTNVRAQPQSICGVYAFVLAPHSLSIEGTQRNYTSPAIECSAQELVFGTSVSDTLRFSCLTATYDSQPGAVRLRCCFFSGNDGVPWEETDFVELGVLTIQLGRPSN